MTDKPRLDELLVERGFFNDLHAAQAAVLAGEVVVGFHCETSAGKRLDRTVDIRLKNRSNFVSRGGKKLHAALQAFDVEVEGKNCADLGTSSGGFTDCLLQAGAAHVSSIDVGYGQFVWSLRNDKRVSLYERTNIRNLDPASVDGPFDLVVGDLSFISLKKIMPDVRNFCKCGAQAILLIKPQFEAAKTEVDEGGIVHNREVHTRVIEEVIASANDFELSCLGLAHSPVTGAKGNIEYLIFLRRSANVENDSNISNAYINELVCCAHESLGGKS